jgi:hypothetical protein
LGLFINRTGVEGVGSFHQQTRRPGDGEKRGKGEMRRWEKGKRSAEKMGRWEKVRNRSRPLTSDL